MQFKNKNYWAVILGGSSGFGLATAKELARRGMNICLVHRDRRGALPRIEKEIEEIKRSDIQVASFNLDALSKEGREKVLNELPPYLGSGKVRLLVHSIAFGSLKLIAPRAIRQGSPVARLAEQVGCSAAQLQSSIDTQFQENEPALHPLATPPAYEDELLLDEEEMLNTIGAMGTSLLTWTQELFKRKLFGSDARVVGLTSEGNEVAWLGYAAVSAAKATLEAISRSIAKEYGPHGIRSNIVQPGITITPALKLIPGSAQMIAKAKLRNPLGRLTEVEDVARVIAMLASDEAGWINGSLIRVDGGERISGA